MNTDWVRTGPSAQISLCHSFAIKSIVEVEKGRYLSFMLKLLEKWEMQYSVHCLLLGKKRFGKWCCIEEEVLSSRISSYLSLSASIQSQYIALRDLVIKYFIADCLIVTDIGQIMIFITITIKLNLRPEIILQEGKNFEEVKFQYLKFKFLCSAFIGS